MTRPRSNLMRPAALLRARAGSGFTLLEILVAVGAVALVAVGLAAIFDAVGKTVTGGRRVSMLNTYASLIERRMRDDFEHMSRDGFLVIRQQYAVVSAPQVPSAGPVLFDPLLDKIPVNSSGDNARPRRIDEIVFFTRGKVQSTRTPLVSDPAHASDAIPSSNEARVYFGHGQRRRTTTGNGQASDLYYRPFLNDILIDSVQAANESRLGVQVDGNPNRYAVDWTLLRNVTVLTQPAASESDVIATPQAFNLQPGQKANSDTQIALQPAAASIFRSINLALPNPGQAAQPRLIRPPDLTNGRSPNFASGIVDVATTDLEEIRSHVIGFAFLPSAVTPSQSASAFIPAARFAPTSLAAPGAFPTSLDLMQAWMNDAFPAESDASRGYANDPPGVRMRYEPEPPDLLTVIAELDATTDTMGQNRALQTAFESADQRQLTRSNFVPRCTEFIVEWSFGSTDGRGETIWFGPHRVSDSNNNFAWDPGEPVVTNRFPFDYNYPPAPPASQMPPVTLTTPYTTIGNTTAYHPGLTPAEQYRFARLFYGISIPPDNAAVLTSFFGYVDPTFNPADPRDTGAGLNSRTDSTDAVENSLPWPWPSLIRVTVTIADQRDPKIEETYQFIFKVPQAGSN